MKAIFTSKIGSGYDDVIEERYHFPRTYLRQVESAIGDQIIYYEPRRGGGESSYFATATVKSITEDRRRPDHFYAWLENFLDFDQKVPFSEDDNYFEQMLRKDDGSTNKGAFGRAVRNIPDNEYQAILAAGFVERADWPETSDARAEFQIGEPDQAPYGDDAERPMVQFSRPFRDRAFTRQVQLAYDRRCAVTGLKLLNGGGRPEVQAAHIKPVAEKGPDSVRNGLALSGTIHWMFDRGLMSIDDDFRILKAKSGIPDELNSLFNRTGYLILPEKADHRPNPHFLKFHRDNVFKG